jgi:hypothetical protein
MASESTTATYSDLTASIFDKLRPKIIEQVMSSNAFYQTYKKQKGWNQVTVTGTTIESDPYTPSTSDTVQITTTDNTEGTVWISTPDTGGQLPPGTMPGSPWGLPEEDEDWFLGDLVEKAKKLKKGNPDLAQFPDAQIVEWLKQYAAGGHLEPAKPKRELPQVEKPRGRMIRLREK